MKSPATLSALNSIKRAKTGQTNYRSIRTQPSDKAKTTAVATPFFARFGRRIEQIRQNLRFAQARRSAYIIFAKRHPDWIISGFDYRFLKHTAAPLLEPIRDNNSQPLPEDLARLWVAQADIDEAQKPDILAKTTAVANTFLYILRTELPFYLPAKHW